MSPNLREKDRRLTGLLVLFAVFGVGALLIGLFLVPPGHLVLVLRDGVFGLSLEHRRTTITLDDISLTLVPRPMGNGDAYDLGRIVSGPHRLRWHVAGYAEGEQTVRVDSIVTTPRTVVQADVRPEFGMAAVHGLDTTTGQAVRGTLAATMDGSEGKASGIAVLFTDLPPGQHAFQAAAAGYCPDSGSATIRIGEKTDASIYLTPTLGPDELARFVLTWDHLPADVDSHLFVKLDGAKDERHVFWKGKSIVKDGKVIATLDVDRRQPGGVETLTIKKGFAGRFRYQVVNYSLLEALRNKQPQPPSLPASKASVRFYDNDGCHPAIFTVPGACTDIGWTVLDIVVDASGAKNVTTINQCIHTVDGQKFSK
jgi:uncharacterized protein YfaP (DUF2135 family)